MKTNNKQLLYFLKEKLGNSLSKDISLILTGSRALGLEDKKSDYDCYLIYDKKSKEKIRNKFLKENWITSKGGIWTNLMNEDEEQVTLMTKTFEEIKNEKEMTMQYVYLNSIILFDPSKKFSNSLKAIKSNLDLEHELRKNYLDFMLDSSILCGMLRKEYSVPVSYFKKGDIIRSLMKLSILLDKKPYPYEKVLYWAFSKSKNHRKINEYIKKIQSLKDAQKAKILRKEIINYVNNIMPEKDYVGKNWWRFER